MRLDLGGIAKGYAVDEAMAVLAKHGIDRALVEVGGDIGLGAPPPGKPGWRDRRRPAGRQRPPDPIPLARPHGGRHLRRHLAVRRNRRPAVLAPRRSPDRRGADRSQQRDRDRPGRHDRRRAGLDRQRARAEEGAGTDRRHARRRRDGRRDSPRGSSKPTSLGGGRRSPAPRSEMATITDLPSTPRRIRPLRPGSHTCPTVEGGTPSVTSESEPTAGTDAVAPAKPPADCTFWPPRFCGVPAASSPRRRCSTAGRTPTGGPCWPFGGRRSPPWSSCRRSDGPVGTAAWCP